MLLAPFEDNQVPGSLLPTLLHTLHGLICQREKGKMNTNTLKDSMNTSIQGLYVQPQILLLLQICSHYTLLPSGHRVMIAVTLFRNEEGRQPFMLEHLHKTVAI